MFERFMVDDLRHWATTYKVGGGDEGEERNGEGTAAIASCSMPVKLCSYVLVCPVGVHQVCFLHQGTHNNCGLLPAATRSVPFSSASSTLEGEVLQKATISSSTT